MKNISIFELLSDINPKLLEAEEVAARTVAKRRFKRRLWIFLIVLVALIPLLFLIPRLHLLISRLGPIELPDINLFDDMTASESFPEPEVSTASIVIPPEPEGSSASPDPPRPPDPEVSSAPSVIVPGTDPPIYDFILPVQGTLIRKYDPDLYIYQPSTGMYAAHDGVDVKTEAGAPVLAAADGRITRIWMDPYYGACLAIEHENNVFTIYKNLSTTLPPGIAEGVSVTQGMTVATVGTTSLEEPRGTPFLHFEMTKDALCVDPLDYLNEAPWRSPEAGT